MAKINVTSGTASAYGQGELQLQNKAPMDSTLRPVTDSANTASPLNLSTSLVQTTSTLKITTNDNPYIDAEDGAGNNRFTVGRDTGSQQVNVDFASNPGGSTTIVGAIRTYVDGVNLSEVMAFREDGNIGINTLTPGAKLDIHSASNVIMQLNRTGAGKSWLQYLQAGTARWNTGYDNTNGNFTIYDAVNAADRMVVTNAGNVGIGTSTPNVYSTSGATNIVTIQASGTDAGGILDIAGTGTGFSGINLGNATIRRAFVGTVDGGNFGIYTNPTNTGTVVSERLTITSAGNVGIGTSTPDAKLTTLVGDNAFAAKFKATNGVFRVLPFETGLGVKISATNGNESSFASLVSQGSDHQFVVGVTEAMRITSAGNVGIGTTAPADKLNLFGTNTTAYVSSSASAVVPAGGLNLAIQNNGTAGYTSLRFISLDGSNAFGYLGFINNTGVSGSFVFGQRTGGNSYAEQMRIDQSGNVGIGTTSPAAKLDVVSTLNVQAINNSDLPYINFSNSGASFNWGRVGGLLTGAGDGSLYFQTKTGASLTEKMQLTDTGYLRLSAGTGGIQFNGDTAAANALDDYEEGTFTPTTAGDATGAFSSVVGEYTKIGNVVNFRLIAQVSANFSSNTIGGLPFTIGGSPSPSGVNSSINIANDNTANLNGFPVVGTSSIIIFSDHITTNAINPSIGMGILRMFGTYRV